MGKFDFYDSGPDRPWDNKQLTSASIVGHTTDTSTRLWVRMWAEGTYWLIVSPAPIPEKGTPFVKKSKGSNQAWIESSDESESLIPGQLMSAEFLFTNDVTHVFEIGDLVPGTTYYYAVFTMDKKRKNPWELQPDIVRRQFRMQSKAPHEITFGLISCHMPYKENGDIVNIQMWERLFEELVDHRADFVIGAGDQVYTDGNKRVSIWRWLKSVKSELVKLPEGEQYEAMRSWYRDIYRGYWGFPKVRAVMSRFPTYQIWDDHEIMDGWGSYNKKELANYLDTLWEWQDSEQNVKLAKRMFEAAAETYVEYQHSHNPKTPDGDYDYSFEWGGFAFYVLDMRGQRDFNRMENRILGKAQLGRLLKWLGSEKAKQSPALFIVSPVPIVHVNNFIVNKLDLPFLGLADDLRDEWEHKSNWIERDEVLGPVFEYSQNNKRAVAFLSGDVHIGGAFRLSRKKCPDARVFQLTSSGITYPPSALLKFIVKDEGTLGCKKEAPEEKRTAFKKLRILNRNNFALISAQPDAGGKGAKVSWDLYGSTGEAEEIVRLTRLWLTADSL